MVELIVEGLPNFTSIYPDNHNRSEIQPLLNQKLLMPQLEKLHISRMEKLKQIWMMGVRGDDGMEGDQPSTGTPPPWMVGVMGKRKGGWVTDSVMKILVEWGPLL
ncbi:hypothetical protein QVD17_18252 [Tagetes erecta]|uniref:Uncharacterized protein n=1 Tax=Tagetes erecta TaxID=13708 RepID=A0AAD8KHF4_TARER|nr:hypothetical protein QVD17_18252 [Tagetes erecta]